METGKVEFNSDYVDGDTNTTDMDGYKYFLVVKENGAMHCSCGRELLRLDDGSYRCKGGYPTYRPDQGEMIKDKNGEIWLKVLPHVNEDQSI